MVLGASHALSSLLRRAIPFVSVGTHRCPSQCFCGSANSDYDALGTATCTSVCDGDPNEICGGVQKISVYAYQALSPVPTPPSPTPSTSGYTELGCYTDKQSDRLLSADFLSSSDMTTEVS